MRAIRAILQVIVCMLPFGIFGAATGKEPTTGKKPVTNSATQSGSLVRPAKTPVVGEKSALGNESIQKLESTPVKGPVAGTGPAIATTAKSQAETEVIGDQAVADKLMQNLVETVTVTRELASAHKAITAVEGELETVRSKRPVVDTSWQSLKIGEFETEQKFKARKQASRETAEATHRAAVSAWEKSLADIEINRKKLISALEIQRAAAVIRLRELERAPYDLIRLGDTSHSRRLPYFDREKMRFSGLVFELPEKTVTNSNDKKMVATLTFVIPEIDIVLPTLEEAERFKEEYRSGKVKFTFGFCPQLIRIESPIVEPGKTVFEQKSGQRSNFDFVEKTRSHCRCQSSIIMGTVLRSSGCCNAGLQTHFLFRHASY